ncbi:MAG: hypothetical protein LUM44_03330 [Pyrinomonadaceae bacterium]|nr:hypothetical protein [Pyrinomonadaceae bacterium]
MSDFDPFKGPETKSEVKEAANVLFILGVLFALGSLFGVGVWFSKRNSDWLIVAGVLVLIMPLLLAAGAYNIYYTQRMEHHPFVTKALRNPSITVFVIFVLMSFIVFGATALIVFLN